MNLSASIKHLKLLLFFIFYISAFQTAQSQNKSLIRILTSQHSRIKDTVFHLKTANNVTADLPVTIISGSKSGPTFTVTAGIHGTEYPTIVSLLQLRKEIDPEKLTGNLIIIPVMNMQSFYKRTAFVNPDDNVNLNRIFPGNPNGTITEVIADFITTQVFDATDVYLDMHGGDLNEDLIPFACYYDNKEFKEQTLLAASLCEASGFSTIVSYPYILPSGQPPLYAFKQAVRLGIPALSIEIGKLGNCEKSDTSAAKNAVYRMLAELKMYENKKIAAKMPSKIRYNRQTYVPGPGRGIFYSSFKAGNKVIKDEEIGYITDIFGHNVKIITAPENGTILYKVGRLPVNEGETLFCIGHKAAN